MKKVILGKAFHAKIAKKSFTTIQTKRNMKKFIKIRSHILAKFVRKVMAG